MNKEVHLNELQMHLTKLKTDFMEEMREWPTPTPNEKESLYLLAFWQINTHPNTHPNTQPSPTPRPNLMICSLKCIASKISILFPMSRVGCRGEWLVECRLGVAPSLTPALPLYIKAFQEIGVGVGPNRHKMSRNIKSRPIVEIASSFGCNWHDAWSKGRLWIVQTNGLY